MHYWARHREATVSALRTVDPDVFDQLIDLIAYTRGDYQIFLAGNGGSAATADHIAAELNKLCSIDQPYRYRAISLTAHPGYLTALANDEGYESVFVEGLRNFARPGDVFIAISGSGNSENLIKAVKWANKHWVQTVGFSHPCGALLQHAKIPVLISSLRQAQVEEAAFVLLHSVCYALLETQAAADESTDAS